MEEDENRKQFLPVDGSMVNGQMAMLSMDGSIQELKENQKDGFKKRSNFPFGGCKIPREKKWFFQDATKIVESVNYWYRYLNHENFCPWRSRGGGGLPPVGKFL